MEEIYGHIERITFQNLESGFTVAQLQRPKQKDLTCIVGSMPLVQPGETIRCFGTWKQHLMHGRQFEVQRYKSEAPADITGIKKYLGSGLIKGIGPTYANRIVEIFGVETLHIIDESPEKLLSVPGLGQKRMEKIKSCWSEQKSIREVMIFLQSYGVSPSYAQKIFKAYRAESIKIVKENPYQLSREIFGIGFKTADTLAQKMGIAKDSSKRIEAGIEYVLNELAEDGHTCYPYLELVVEAEKILEVDRKLIQECLEILKKEERVVIFELVVDAAKQPYVWLKLYFWAEVGIAREIKRLKDHASGLRNVDMEKALTWVQSLLKIELATNQQAAVAAALSSKMLIITGGPGTGKSTITNAILRITEKLTANINLAAPTGRAAKRMSEITGRKATTIHSLLEFNPNGGGFKRTRNNPLECDLLIVDEASMIDTFLMFSLLKAIPSHTRVIFVGDINQLPSVGAGNVLRDIIQADCIPVIMLNEIFRQAAGSRIITNSHRINQGIFPDVNNHSQSDFFFSEAETPEAVLSTILGLVTKRLPQKYGFNAFQDIQVLAPMRKGLIGTENLNVAMQEALNPQPTPLLYGGRKFQVGDKVMQIRNNYKKEVFNGDIGIISSIDSEDDQMIVQFDGKDLPYEFTELDEIVLAYAVSIHKYQGSECPCVIIPVHTTHFMMLHRNLLYTGVTRGKKLVILVGTTRAIAIAVKNDQVKKRHTGLNQAIIETNHPPLPNLYETTQKNH